MAMLSPFRILLFILITITTYTFYIIDFDQVQLKFLATDWLIYILLFSIGIFVYQSRNKEHLRAPWRHVVRRPLAMISLVVLLFYVLIGVLDSIHYQTALKNTDTQSEVHFSGEVLSVLDALLIDIKTHQEKTYSSPFATHLFAKENIDTPQGQRRDYPRLKYGGAHLKNPKLDKTADIMRLISISAVETIVFVLAISFYLVLWLSYTQERNKKEVYLEIIKNKSEIPWLAIILTCAIAVLFVFLLINIATKYHMLGTDKVGQDVLYLSLKSIRTGLVIGTLTTLIMLPFAVFLGITAGYFKGWADDVIQYLYTTLNSIPGVLLIAAAILSLDVYITNNPDIFKTVTERADMRLLFLCMILGITSWTGLCRLLRAETLKLSQLDYVEAATAFGIKRFKIITRHIFPNVLHIVLIAVVLDFSSLVLAEAVLSYVGVGVDPSTISWGNMINGARLEMAREPVVWWSLVAAFFFMFNLVLAANLFSDAVRDAFDPRLNRAR